MGTTIAGFTAGQDCNYGGAAEAIYLGAVSAVGGGNSALHGIVGRDHLPHFVRCRCIRLYIIFAAPEG